MKTVIFSISDYSGLGCFSDSVGVMGVCGLAVRLDGEFVIPVPDRRFSKLLKKLCKTPSPPGLILDPSSYE